MNITADLLRCARCRAYYLDDEDGRRAHTLVFGHRADPEEASP